jgi:lantibiotic modifying enzyme
MPGRSKVFMTPMAIGSGGFIDIDTLLQAARFVEKQILEWEESRIVSAVAGYTTERTAVDLYGGPPGLALFWAAMARIFPQERLKHAERSRENLLATRRWISEWLAEPARMDAAGVQLGGVCGLGGALYALTCVGVLLGEEDLLREALAATALFTPERISRDRRFDFIDGCAGAILALLALDRSLEVQGLHNEGPLEVAFRCAQHLLSAQGGTPGNPRTWEVERISFCGFAHGAAGILHALLRIYERTGDHAHLEAARDAMAFERGLYQSGVANWVPYSGFNAGKRPMVAWCWGAPGIALGRIAALAVLDDAEIREDIRSGLQATLGQPQTLEDHICCGNLGRAQILAYAAREFSVSDSVLDPETLREAVDRLVSGVLRHAKGRGGFRWSASPNETFRPFFFKGAAGVGYAFLYLAKPGMLPLPLLLEAPPPYS